MGGFDAFVISVEVNVKDTRECYISEVVVVDGGLGVHDVCVTCDKVSSQEVTIVTHCILFHKNLIFVINFLLLPHFYQTLGEKDFQKCN